MRVAQALRLKTAHLPAPLGGLNTVDPASALPLSDALVRENLIDAQNGLRSRLGYKEWSTNLGGGVRTIVPFAGSDAGQDKLFAATSAGIWDCTTSSALPTLVRSFASTGGLAGWGASTVFVTNGGHFAVYCDEVNGYHLYGQGSGWSPVAQGTDPGQIDGADPRTFAFATAWKNRLLFVQRDTATAYYLPVGQVTGTVARFDFGGKFKAGGTLVGLWSWTIDGGAGMDDYLVAISSAGDVVIYQGTDPSSASSFSMKGSWFVGAVPAGRRIATDFGGDLLILSTLGALPLSRLVSGSAVESSAYATAKIGNLFNVLATERGNLRGWEIRLHPEDATLLVTVPDLQAKHEEQLAMSLTRRAWSRYRGVPMLSTGVWQGKLYCGTPDGRLIVNTGYLDAVTLSNSNPVAVPWSLLSAYSDLGAPRNKRVQMIQPLFVTEGAQPTFEVGARYDFDLAAMPGTQVVVTSGATQASPLDALVAAGSSWDEGKWDEAIWSGTGGGGGGGGGGGSGDVSLGLYGATGIGRHVAIALRGAVAARTTLVGINVTWDEGGLR